MSRGIGAVGSIQDAIPDWLALGLGVLTQLGDAWFLFLVLAALYWSRPQRQTDLLLVSGTYVAGIGLYRYLKVVFALPRPNEPLLDPELVPWLFRPVYELTAVASGYGFPSGHATSSTIVYVGLATVLTEGTTRRRYAAAAALVGLVSFTRVALGVHFLVDVVAGVILGTAMVLLTFRGIRPVVRDSVTVVFLLAVATSFLYLFESGVELEAVLVCGLAVGLVGGWQLVFLARRVATERPSRARVAFGFRGVLAALSLASLLVALASLPFFPGEPYPLGGLVGLLAALAVVVPIARYSPRVRTGLSVSLSRLRL